VGSEAKLKMWAAPAGGAWMGARSRSRRARRRPRSIALALALWACAWLCAASSAGAAPEFKDGHGLHVSAVAQLDPRLLEVTVTTAGLPAPTQVRILLRSS